MLNPLFSLNWFPYIAKTYFARGTFKSPFKELADLLVWAMWLLSNKPSKWNEPFLTCSFPFWTPLVRPKGCVDQTHSASSMQWLPPHWQDLGKDSVDGSNMLTSLLQIPFTSPSGFFTGHVLMHDRNRKSLRIRPMFDSELYDCLLQPRLSAMQPPISPHLAMPDLLSPRLPAFWTRNDGENSLGHEWSWKQIYTFEL